MRRIIFCLLLTASVSFGVTQTQAEDRKSSKGNSDQKKQIYQTIKQIEKAQKKLARQFNKLNSAAKADVIAKTSTKTNSDNDSLNDYLEDALKLNKCSDDSNNDGITDGDEFKDDDSDDDSQGVEFEVHKTIQSIDSSSVLLGGVLYVINSNTKLMNDDKRSVPIGFFTVGKCVEAEGYISGDSKILKKLKEDDDC